MREHHMRRFQHCVAGKTNSGTTSDVQACPKKTRCKWSACYPRYAGQERFPQRTLRGVTLVELCVVFAILGILTSLTLSAVQYARESSRRVQCSENLREMGLGMQLFHNRNRIIAPNGGPDDTSLLRAVDGSLVQPYTFDATTNRTYYWGIGSPKRIPREQTGPWCYAILPLIGYQDQYEQDRYELQFPLLLCPTRGRLPPKPPADDDYGAYESGGHQFGKTDYCANSNAVPNLGEFNSFASISDGTSHTVLLGEKAYDPLVQTITSWYWDEPIWIGGSKGTARAGDRIFTDELGIPFKENWGSPHASGAHFCLADGSVQFLSSSIESEILGAAMTINSSETDSLLLAQ